MNYNEIFSVRQLQPEYADEITLRSLVVTMKLGDSRDVLLALKDAKRSFRKDSAFLQPEGLAPAYRVEKDRLVIDYPAGTPSGNRLFFNLKGQGVGNIEDHNLTVFADYFWDDGTLREVAKTPLDFREETPVGERIRMGYEPLVRQKGYDHVFVLDKHTPKLWKPEAGSGETVVGSRAGRMVASAADVGKSRAGRMVASAADVGKSRAGRRVTPPAEVDGSRAGRRVTPPAEVDGAAAKEGDEDRGREDFEWSAAGDLRLAAVLMDRMRTLQMNVYTTFPAIHVYTGNRFSGKDIGKGGCIYPCRAGIMLAPCEDPVLEAAAGSALAAAGSALAAAGSALAAAGPSLAAAEPSLKAGEDSPQDGPAASQAGDRQRKFNRVVYEFERI